MTAYSSRIIILEAESMQRLHIEKILNGIGYYRILPLDSYEDFLSVVKSTTVAFDLLIANSSFIECIELNEYNLLKHSPVILNTLIYVGSAVKPLEIIDAPTPRIIRKLSTPPNDQSIKAFLDLTTLSKNKTHTKPAL